MTVLEAPKPAKSSATRKRKLSKRDAVTTGGAAKSSGRGPDPALQSALERSRALSYASGGVALGAVIGATVGLPVAAFIGASVAGGVLGKIIATTTEGSDDETAR